MSFHCLTLFIFSSFFQVLRSDSIGDLRSFEQVIVDFQSLVGSVEDGAFQRLSSTSIDEKDFKMRVKDHEGKSGFMQFLLIDHGEWLSHVNIIGKKARMYTIGNPLIAETMLKYDIRVGLNVPIRLFIYENKIDNTVRITYDLPSSLMTYLNNENITIAAKKLDVKLEDLCKQVANTIV
ncbi:hypothetical protein I4U23_011123 [Adineta vaga]|nr:hypothetical protein I4U23_011123 [Adineta vaga]